MSDSFPEDVSLDPSPSTIDDETGSLPGSEEAPPSVLDAVEAALAGSQPSEVSRTEDGSTVNHQRPARNGSESSSSFSEEEPSPEELRQYSPRAQERIRELAAMKNDLRNQVARLETEGAEHKTKADAFDELSRYLGSSGISAEEANNALEITRLIKNQDFDRAFAIMTPIYQELKKLVGGVLDADLQEDVKNGRLVLDRAQELQRGRAAEANGRMRESAKAEADERKRAAEDADARSAEIHNLAKAADGWAATKRDADPEGWARKEELVVAQVSLLIQQEGVPETVEGVVEQSERALAIVERGMASAAPKGRPPAAKSEVRTPFEVVERALAESTA